MSWLDRLRRAVAREQFHPRALGVLTNPFYFARRGLREAVGALAPEIRGRVLDVGCGSRPYRELFDVSEYVGMDVEQSGHDHARETIDVLYDGETFPFPDGAFDSVVCFQVLEHVFHPARFLEEIRRVLRPDGTLLLSVPFVWDEHEQPYDYARYSSFGLRHLLAQHGLDEARSIKTCADARAPLQLFNAYLFKLAQGRLPAIGGLCLTAPLNLAGLVAQRVLPANVDLYLDNVVLARRR